MNKISLRFHNPLLEKLYFQAQRSANFTLFFNIQKGCFLLVLLNSAFTLVSNFQTLNLCLDILIIVLMSAIYFLQNQKPDLFNLLPNVLSLVICVYSIGLQFLNEIYIIQIGPYNTQLYADYWFIVHCCLAIIGSNTFLNLATFCFIICTRILFLQLKGGFFICIFLCYMISLCIFTYTFHQYEENKRKSFAFDKKQRQKDQILEKLNQSVAIFGYNSRENAYNIQFMNIFLKRQHQIKKNSDFIKFINDTKVFKQIQNRKSVHQLSYLVWEMFNQVNKNITEPQIEMTLYFYRFKQLYKIELTTSYDEDVSFIMLISNMSPQFQIQQSSQLLKHHKQLFINSTNKWINLFKYYLVKGHISQINQILYSIRSLQILLYNRIKQQIGTVDISMLLKEIQLQNPEGILEKTGIIPSNIYTNKYKLWFILQILILNALRYSNDNKVEIQIKKIVEPLKKEYIEFKVINKISRMKLVTKVISTKFYMKEILKDKSIKLRAVNLLVEDIGFGLTTSEEGGVFTAMFNIVEGLDRERLKQKRSMKKMKISSKIDNKELDINK